MVPLRRCSDERGLLLPLDWESLPFTPRRIFTVSGVPAGTVRGGHGHRTCAQLLVAIAGEIEVQLAHGGERRRVVLTPDSPALLVRAGVWFSQTYLSEGAVLLVLASEPYNAAAIFDDPEQA
ncbi:sugar 3,4-ketoisomerase [Haliea sp.]